MPPSTPADLPWDPLTEDELKFCWHALVENGQLSVGNLKKFMRAVAGEDISKMQATDLLVYLDANGDGKVGFDEFVNFMSFSDIRMTDPSTFMWAPTKKFRDDRGINSKSKAAQSAEEEKKDLEDDDRGFPSLLDAWGEGGDQASATPEPSRPSLKQQSPSTAVAKAGKPGTGSPSRARRRDKSEDLEEPLTPPPPQTPAASVAATPAKPVKKLEVDPKLRTKIGVALEKHEQVTWDRLLHEQEIIRKKFFQQYALATPGAMDSREYHKMVSELHNLARQDMPGELKAADSLAALQSIIEHNQPPAKKSDKDKEKGEKGDDAAIEAVMQKAAVDLKLTYDLWNRTMAGKDRWEAKVEKTGK